LQRQVRQLWESKYKPVDTVSRTEFSDSATSPTADQAASKPAYKPVNQYAAYLQQFKVKALAQVDDAASRDDEYSRYIKERVEWVEDPIAWWLLQKHRYPNLSQMALDILSIPCMSADVERLFSSCGLTLEDRRNRMGPELLEALECLKSWQKIKEFDILESLVGSDGKM
jgi:hypothetical protein